MTTTIESGGFDPLRHRRHPEAVQPDPRVARPTLPKPPPGRPLVRGPAFR